MMPMAQPMSAFFERGRVVNTVTSDGDNVTKLLAVLDDLELLLWRSACEHLLRVREAEFPERIIVVVLDFPAWDHDRRGVTAKVPRDRILEIRVALAQAVSSVELFAVFRRVAPDDADVLGDGLS